MYVNPNPNDLQPLDKRAGTSIFTVCCPLHSIFTIYTFCISSNYPGLYLYLERIGHPVDSEFLDFVPDKNVIRNRTFIRIVLEVE